jgi:hypothetical protein
MNAQSSLATALPAMRWCGWRPPFLDHRADERGGHLVLMLEREGETMLLPCAMITYCFAFPAWEGWQEADALRRTWGDGADAQVLDLAVHQLEADGWHVTGRLVIEFVGVLAEDDFWQQVQAVLRQDKEDG